MAQGRDSLLVADIVAGDARALNELLARYGPEIRAVAFLIVQNDADAEEVLADTMVTAWRKAASVRDRRRFRPWLLRVATRAALTRRGPRVRQVPLDAAAMVQGADADPTSRIALSDALAELPARMRAVVALRYVADLTVPDIARTLDRSENTINSQLREARHRLRTVLAADRDEHGTASEE